MDIVYFDHPARVTCIIEVCFRSCFPDPLPVGYRRSRLDTAAIRMGIWCRWRRCAVRMWYWCFIRAMRHQPAARSYASFATRGIRQGRRIRWCSGSIRKRRRVTPDSARIIALPFPLLVDEGGKVCDAYNTRGLMTKRTVYLIGPDGVIRYASRGKPAVDRGACGGRGLSSQITSAKLFRSL